MEAIESFFAWSQGVPPKSYPQKNPPTPRRVGTWLSMERKERARVVCCLFSFCLFSYLCAVKSFSVVSFVSLRVFLEAVYIVVYISPYLFLSLCLPFCLRVHMLIVCLFDCLSACLCLSVCLAVCLQVVLSELPLLLNGLLRCLGAVLEAIPFFPFQSVLDGSICLSNLPFYHSFQCSIDQALCLYVFIYSDSLSMCTYI